MKITDLKDVDCNSYPQYPIKLFVPKAAQFEGDDLVWDIGKVTKRLTFVNISDDAKTALLNVLSKSEEGIFIKVP